MKVVLTFAFLIAGISAVPSKVNQIAPIDFTNERIVTDAIESAIQDLADSIQDAGLDPLHIKREGAAYALPVPVLFNYVAFIEELLSTGLSNIVVNEINFSVLTSRLTFDIELPLIHGSVAEAAADVEIFGNKFDFRASGQVEIVRIRVTGNIRFNINIITGISIRSIDIDLTLGGIDSDLRLIVLGRDISAQVNGFIGGVIPDTIEEFREEINRLLEILLLDIINDML